MSISTAGRHEPLSAVDDGLRFNTECRGAHHGQTDFRTRALDAHGRMVGHVDHCAFDHAIHLAYIEVDARHRRQHIGLRLLDHVQREDPEAPIRFGSTTPEGTELQRSWHRGDAIRLLRAHVAPREASTWATAFRTGRSAWYVDLLTNHAGATAMSAGTGERWQDGLPLPPSVRNPDASVELFGSTKAHRSAAVPRFLFSASEWASSMAVLREAAADGSEPWNRRARSLAARMATASEPRRLPHPSHGEPDPRKLILSVWELPHLQYGTSRLAEWHPDCFRGTVEPLSGARREDFLERLAGRAQSAVVMPPGRTP